MRELLLLAEPIDAARALQMGLVQQVVPEQQLLQAALKLSELVCQGGPQALRATKELLRSAATATDEQFHRQAVQAHMTARNSPEAAEGLAAFQEKRKPNWTAT
jgi:enoyl-CoA hydratase/carnithine racemase